MPSTVRSASGWSARSVSASRSPSSKNASRVRWPGSSEPDPELIYLPVERRQREAEPLRRDALVAVRPPQHAVDVHALVGAERFAEVVARDRLRPGGAGAVTAQH